MRRGQRRLSGRAPDQPLRLIRAASGPDPALYNEHVKAWDVIVVGGGVIGLALGLALRRVGMKVLVLDKNQPGREASWAAGGMIAQAEVEEPLRPLAAASARMYSEFVQMLEDESRLKIDLRSQGTIVLGETGKTFAGSKASPVTAQELRELEPEVRQSGPGMFLEEQSVDPRGLVTAMVAAAKHLGVDVAAGAEVTDIELEHGHVARVQTRKTSYVSGNVVNCAGAWAGEIGPVRVPVRPVKGHMLAVAAEVQGKEHSSTSATHIPALLVQHAIRAGGTYIIPRSDGRMVIGSTLEEMGFDKRVDPDIIRELHDSAARVLPRLSECRMLESWTGLRPGTPDKLPILGPTDIEGYYLSAGHYRDGILLAPVTALVMSQLLRGMKPEFDLGPFSPGCFRD